MSEMESVEAVKSGDTEVVRQLITSGAEVNRQGRQGWTALNWAAARGSLEMSELLIQHGADPLAVRRDLRTPR
jgi:ankyrin repeat protein